MKKSRKASVIGLMLVFCLLFGTISASAATRSFNFTFNGTSGTLSVNSGMKNDSEQNYYLTISGGNLSKTNIFGTRIRRAADDEYMSEYVLHTSYETSQSYPYATTVDTSTYYYMKAKKDSDSTSSTALNASGRVTY